MTDATSILREQNMEYERALEEDIRREEMEAQEEEERVKETERIAKQQWEDERLHLSPRSLRAKRLSYFEKDTRCIAFTARGERCKKQCARVRSLNLCYIHGRKYGTAA